jgi:hypothetical protein
MPNEEFKTLLRFEGDASGAKRAAQETKSALEELGTGAVISDRRTTEATQQTTEAIAKKEQKTGQAKSRFDELARSMGTTERAAMRFREAITRISPELGALLDIGFKFSDIWQFGLSKMGMVIGGVTLGVTAVAIAFQKVQEAVKAAEEATRRFAETEERVRVAAAQRQTAAVKGAAAVGLPPAATGKVRALTGRLSDQGIDPETAAAVAPYLVDEAGTQIVGDEEAMQIAAAQQFGFIEPMAGAGPTKRAAALRRAQRRIASAKVAPLVENAASNLAADLAERNETMARGGAVDDIKAFVAEQTHLTGAELDARTETVRRQLAEGLRMGAMLPGTHAAITNPDAASRLIRDKGYEAIPLEIEDPLVTAIKKRSQGRQAPSDRAELLQSQIESIDIDIARSEFAAHDPERSSKEHESARRQIHLLKQREAGLVSQQNTIINNYNHGVINQGSDARYFQKPRVTNP